MIESSNFYGLFCELTLPLAWSPTTEADTHSHSFEFSNQNCLKIILGLDEVSQDVADDLPEIGHELQRLDFKINIILELIAQLTAQNSQLPEAVDIKLGSTLLQWSTAHLPPRPDQYVKIEIYPDPRYPFPVILFGKVTSVEPVLNDYQVTLGLCLADKQSQELLDKYIFRCHRRHIAKIKSLKTD